MKEIEKMERIKIKDEKRGLRWNERRGWINIEMGIGNLFWIYEGEEFSEKKMKIY